MKLYTEQSLAAVNEENTIHDLEYEIYDLQILASLINISGRQRMLSQRIAFLLCARMSEATRQMSQKFDMTNLGEELSNAISLFDASHKILTQGNSIYPAPIEHSELFDYFHGDQAAHLLISQFLTFARDLIDGRRRDFGDFYQLSALDIVPLLNEGVQVYERISNRLSKRIAANMLNKNRNIRNTFQEVRDIHHMIKAVSLNAAIAAARAGDYGSEFHVIVGEIKNLAGQIEDLVENGLQTLKDSQE